MLGGRNHSFFGRRMGTRLTFDSETSPLTAALKCCFVCSFRTPCLGNNYLEDLFHCQYDVTVS